MKYSAILTALCCGLLAVAAEKPNILICTEPSLPPEVASAARELLKLENTRPLAALAACGAGEKAEAAESASLLPDSAFNRAAFNHLVVIGRPDRDPLQAKVRGHQAKVDPADREFYRLGQDFRHFRRRGARGAERVPGGTAQRSCRGWNAGAAGNFAAGLSALSGSAAGLSRPDRPADAGRIHPARRRRIPRVAGVGRCGTETAVADQISG